jgi:hypothetical protein
MWYVVPSNFTNMHIPPPTLPGASPPEFRDLRQRYSPPVDLVVPEFCDSKQLKPLFGLSRSHAYLLASEGKIRTVCLRRKGTVRGRRLFDCESIRSFFAKCAQ